jgi:SsrA-binding protein
LAACAITANTWEAPLAARKKDKKGGSNVLARNRKARFDYFIDSTFEAGVALKGSEVKSVKAGRVSLKEAYVDIRRGEAFLIGSHIAEWPFANLQNHKPTRTRKLLLHKGEIRRLQGKVQERGYTLVPVSMYLKRGIIKLEVGLARGKRKYDKRESIRRKDQLREQEQSLKW